MDRSTQTTMTWKEDKMDARWSESEVMAKWSQGEMKVKVYRERSEGRIQVKWRGWSWNEGEVKVKWGWNEDEVKVQWSLGEMKGSEGEVKAKWKWSEMVRWSTIRGKLAGDGMRKGIAETIKVNQKPTHNRPF